MKNVGCKLGKAVPIFIGGVFMVAFCFFLTFFDFRSVVDDRIFNIDLVYYVIKILMAFCFLFLGFGVLFILRSMLFYRKRMIEFNREYMTDNSSYVGGGRIRYRDNEAAYICGTWLCIRLRNADEFLGRQNLLKRLFMRCNKKMGYEYIVISDSFLDTDLYTIKEMIDERIGTEESVL